jgi:hypothetical protein
MSFGTGSPIEASTPATVTSPGAETTTGKVPWGSSSFIPRSKPAAPRSERAANRIRCIRETRWKYARYFDANGSYPEEFELYDLDNDPTEITNLAYDPTYKKERERLAKKLAQRERDAIS